MANKSTDPQYFTYKFYNELKSSFEYTPTDPFHIIFAKDLIRRVTNTPPKESNLYDTFLKLKKFISRHHSFYKYHRDNCCNYINYWLNKTVRDSDYGINEENFEIFDEFMRIDPVASDGPFNCISKLSYMDNDSFQKMKKLYDLYDDFTEFKKKEDRSSLCRNISVLTRKYLSVMNEYKRNDNNLYNMLTNLKDVISKDELVTNNVCTKNTFDLYILKMHQPKRPTVQKRVQVYRRHHGRTPTRSTVSVSSSRAQGLEKPEQVLEEKAQVLEEKAQVLEGKAQVLEGKTQVLEEQAQLLEEQVPEEIKPTLSVPQEEFPLPRPLTLLPLGQSETDEYANPKGPYRISELEQGQLQEHGQRPSSELQEWPEEPQERDAHYFREDEEYTSLQEADPPAGSMQSTYNAGTIMGTIKGAVSNVLEAVEPVPIMGVSGGMGALYLLFKYTPIGSLFRRNRRNNQNIPNFFDPRYGEQFSGYYPQYYNEGFPNYRMNIAYHPSSDELD